MKNLEKDIGNFNALYIKISKLENPNLKTVQKKGLLDTFDNITRKNNGEIFSLPNDDLVVVYRAIAKEEIQACIIKIRFILQPATVSETSETFIIRVTVHFMLPMEQY